MPSSAVREQLQQAAQERITRLRERLERHRLGGALLSALPHIRYLTGFSGSSALLLVLREQVHFVTDDRYAEQVRQELFTLEGLQVHISREPMKALAAALDGVSVLAFQPEYLSYGMLLEARRRFRPVRLRPLRQMVEPLIMQKYPAEIELMRRAAWIASKTFEALLERIREGMSERELAAELSYLARQLGSEGGAFEPIVASGERGALPHGRASAKRVRAGELITMDFGCLVRGYSSDLTRTVVLGRASSEQRRVYQVVLQAQERAIGAVRPGVAARAVDAAAREWITAAGFGEYFRHSVGHGLGLSVHEPPALSPRAPARLRLQERTVVTIEPGIYLPGRFGIRIEDDLCVTTNGAELLTTATRELLSL